MNASALSTLGRSTLGYSTIKSGGGTMRGGTMRPGDTSTIQRKKNMKEKVRQKLEDMANEKFRSYERKLFTDANIKWLKPSETLRQQDIIHPQQPVMLRRKFFYADKNVEEHDPVQLNLLYEQCRDSIVKEEYPVTRETAAELAGIQAMILHNSYIKEKHGDGGKLELDNMFPPAFLKKHSKKSIQKKIVQEWKSLTEQLSQNDEKVDLHRLKHKYVKIYLYVKFLYAFFENLFVL